VFLSDAARSIVRGQLSEGTALLDLQAQRLKDLLEPEHIWQLVHPDLPRDFPPLATLDVRKHNLPLQPTPFIGREREVDAMVQALQRGDVRLWTLMGSGGGGDCS